MTLAIATIVSNIAALSVSGVTIKDMDSIPEQVLARDCPIMIPEPVDFVSDFEVERNTYGSAAQSKKTVRYTLNYSFLYQTVGATRTGLDIYGDMVDKAFAIFDAIISNDDLGSTVEFTPFDTVSFGVVLDPSGNTFLGCRILVRVTEFIN